MNASEPAGRLLLLARRLGAAASLILFGAAVASALGSRAAAAGTEPAPASAPAPASEPAPAAAPAAMSAPAVTAEPAVPGEPPSAVAGPAAARASPCDRASAGAVVHLNQATSEQLQQLPGIGPAKAARILEHRRRHGRFRSLRDLRRVKGIGARTLQRLAPLLSLEPPASSPPAGNPPASSSPGKVHGGR